jgi:hypothetical protein
MKKMDDALFTPPRAVYWAEYLVCSVNGIHLGYGGGWARSEPVIIMHLPAFSPGVVSDAVEYYAANKPGDSNYPGGLLIGYFSNVKTDQQTRRAWDDIGLIYAKLKDARKWAFHEPPTDADIKRQKVWYGQKVPEWIGRIMKVTDAKTWAGFLAPQHELNNNGIDELGLQALRKGFADQAETDVSGSSRLPDP